jgi:long-subunit fatty acid transport protein
VIGWGAVAHAGGFEVAQQSAVAGGTGHASTARPGDPAAAWFDPAALADDGGLRVALGAAVAAVTVRAEWAEGDAVSDNALGTPPHLYASWSGHHVLAGVAANTAFAGGARWPDDSALRFESQETSPRFFRVAPFVGGRVGKLQVAGGLHVDTGGLGIRKATDHVTEEGTATIALRATGVGADASVYVAATEALSVGLSWKGRTRLPLAGEVDFDVPAPFAPALPDQTVSADWTLPDRLALGAAWTGASWRVLADVVYTAWSVNDALVLDFADPATDDVTQQNDWRDSVAVRGGGEVDVSWATLRLGGYAETAPSPVTTLGPSSPDGPRVGGTLGVGACLSDVFRVDAFGEVLRVLPRTSTAPNGPPAATYQGLAGVGGLTVALEL